MQRTPLPQSATLLVKCTSGRQHDVSGCCRNYGVELHAMVVVFLDLGKVNVDEVYARDDAQIEELLQIAHCCDEGVERQRWRCGFDMGGLCPGVGRVCGAALFNRKDEAIDGGHKRGKLLHHFMLTCCSGLVSRLQQNRGSVAGGVLQQQIESAGNGNWNGVGLGVTAPFLDVVGAWQRDAPTGAEAVFQPSTANKRRQLSTHRNQDRTDQASPHQVPSRIHFGRAKLENHPSTNSYLPF